MKEILRDATQKGKRIFPKTSEERMQSGVIRSRSVPMAVVSHFADKVKSLQPHIEEVLQAEAVAKLDRIADSEAAKAQNLIEHADAIKSRPQREWFVSTKEKEATKAAAAEKAKVISEKAGKGLHRMTRKKRRAREALEALSEHPNFREGDEASSSAKTTSMKGAARAHKREKEHNEMARQKMTLQDLDIDREKSAKKRKVVVSSDALGDSSMFSEERVAYSREKKGEEVLAASR